MSKRFGRKRVPDCRCEYNFTCRACLTAALPWRAADAEPAPVDVGQLDMLFARKDGPTGP